MTEVSKDKHTEEEVLDAEQILEKLVHLPKYNEMFGKKPGEMGEKWEGTVGNVHFSGMKDHVASHSANIAFNLHLDGSEEERKKVITHFIEALGEPGRTTINPKKPNEESLLWYDIHDQLEFYKYKGIKSFKEMNLA